MRTPVYDGLRLNTASSRMRFAEGAIPRHSGPFASAAAFHAYLSSIVESLDLKDRVVLGREVVSAYRNANDWVLSFAGRADHRCRHIILATGLHFDPFIPAGFAGFLGSVTHSCDYRGPDRFAGLRVLVVGAGNSGAEIASELVGVAATVDLAVHRPTYVVPREVCGFAFDLIDGPRSSRLPLVAREAVYDAFLFAAKRRARRAGLSTPRTPFLRSPWTVASDLVSRVAQGSIGLRSGALSGIDHTVTFTDSSSGGFDALVLATGYQPRFPQLPRNPPISRAYNDCYLKILPLMDGAFANAYFLGYVVPLGALLPVVESQARWVANVITGALHLPSPLDMAKAVQVDCKADASRFAGSTSPSMFVDPYPYMRRLDAQFARTGGRMGLGARRHQTRGAHVRL